MSPQETSPVEVIDAGPGQLERSPESLQRGRPRSRQRRGLTWVTAIALFVTEAIKIVSIAPWGRQDISPWNLIFADDFATPIPLGGFLDSEYESRWSAYDGFADTSGNGMYSSSVISVGGGALNVYLHTDHSQPLSAAVVPMVDGQWGGKIYGRYDVRFRSDELPGYKMAFLLWPDTNNWGEGEIDFPEVGSLGKGNSLYANIYQKGSSTSGAPGPAVGFTTGTDAAGSGWHTASIEWTPGNVTFLLDGASLGTITDGVPDTRMHWVLQMETALDSPPPAVHVAGHIQVDWVR